MEGRQSYILLNDRIKANAIEAVRQAPEGYSVVISEKPRTMDQNAKMWAMLQDIAIAEPDGRRWVKETWKSAFMHSLGHQVQFCEGLDHSGPFPLGFKTSKLTVKQMADMITCIQEYGDRHQIKWSVPIEKEKGGFLAERTGQ